MLPLLMTTALLQQPSPLAEEGFVLLSNDAELSAWRLPQAEGWVWEEGVIRRQKGGTLFSRAIYEDFVLRLEYRIAKGHNSGLFLHAPLSGRHSAIGMELQIMGDYGRTEPNTTSTGALYDAKAPRVCANKPDGEWNVLEVQLSGRHMKVTLNEQVIHDFDLDDPQINEGQAYGQRLTDRRPRGFIGVQDHGNPVEFRNIWIKVEPERGFEPLLTDTLEGWTADNASAFALQGGVLTCWTPEGETAKLTYTRPLKDYEVRLEYRVEPGAEAYWLPRTSTNERNAPVEVVIGDDTNRAPSVNATGALAGQASTLMRGSLPPGQWNDLRMVFHGWSVEINLNEMPILSVPNVNYFSRYRYAPLNGSPALVVRKGKLELRNVRVRPLSSEPIRQDS
ncbi:MAG: 3-keto-disaccharide hydrolase [Candidatus Zipacnadales bacterium]